MFRSLPPRGGKARMGVNRPPYTRSPCAHRKTYKNAPTPPTCLPPGEPPLRGLSLIACGVADEPSPRAQP